jgi:16S rRNA (guanine527-N7)-methyltransferase
MPPPLTPAEFAGLVPVSRETLERLEAFAALLTAWNQRLNLVGRGTVEDLWRRHILDSAQLHPLIPPGAETLVDLGSGAGFPGVVLAIMGGPAVHLVESDQRKCVFLREAIRVTGAQATVHPVRIEAAPPLKADVVTARALAPLDKLLDLAQRFLKPDTMCLFLKGRTAAEELTAARESWEMTVEPLPSRSDQTGSILRLTNIERSGS